MPVRARRIAPPEDRAHLSRALLRYSSFEVATGQPAGGACVSTSPDEGVSPMPTLSVARRLHGGGVVWFEADRGSRHRRRRVRRVRRARARPTSRRSSRTGRSSPRLRRLRRGLVPRPRRVRLLPQRRRRRLRRAHRRRRRRRRRQGRSRPRAELPGAARARPAWYGQGAGERRRRATASPSRSPTLPSRRERRQLQARRQARRARSRRRSTTSPPRKGANNVATRVKAESKLISVEEVRGGGTMEPHKGSRVSLSRVAPDADNDRRCRPTDYVGDSSDRTGFGGLEAIDEVTMLLRARPHRGAASGA